MQSLVLLDKYCWKSLDLVKFSCLIEFHLWPSKVNLFIGVKVGKNDFDVFTFVNFLLVIFISLFIFLKPN